MNEADSNYTRINVVNLDENGSHFMNETDLTVFHVLQKQMGGKTMIDDEMLRNIQLKFIQVNHNYSRDPSEYKKNVFKVDAKNCEASDFGEHERTQKIIKDWAAFSLLCPDLEEGQGFTL